MRTEAAPMMYDQRRAQQPADQPRDRTEPAAAGSGPLLPADERDRIIRRLGHAINTFADTPRDALEEADAALDETSALLTESIAELRRALRADWQEQDPGTEAVELRLALRQYREITQRLLRL
ncbi:hypothetical protein AB0H82_14000 [Streptomyces sp. NPDC050732]|uniref:hypothetical protein n=1 Tax=Streptomyces sp. NPDC050732 TaxID=3154632 RepID=UPI00343C9BB3